MTADTTRDAPVYVQREAWSTSAYFTSFQHHGVGVFDTTAEHMRRTHQRVVVATE